MKFEVAREADVLGVVAVRILEVNANVVKVAGHLQVDLFVELEAGEEVSAGDVERLNGAVVRSGGSKPESEG